MKLSCRLKYMYTTTEGVATERGGDCTYRLPYLSPRPYSILTRLNWMLLLPQTLEEEGDNNKERTTATTTKSTSPKTTKKRNVWKLWSDETRVAILKTRQRTQRGGEITLTASHSCHRTCIPFGHVLIEHRCSIKRCKSGTTMRKQQQQQQKVPFQKNWKTERVRIDKMNFDLSS